MTGRIVRSVAGMVVALFTSTANASAQPPVLSPATVVGNAATFNWTATAGATGYRIEAGLASGVYGLGSQTLGAVTTISAPGVPNGVYFVRIVALPGGEASNEVRVQLPAPPAAPTNLQVVRNGTAIVALWRPGQGGGTPTSYSLRAGSSPGAANLGSLALAGTSFAVGGVPASLYYLRVAAVNAAGASTESNEVALDMPAGGACDAPPAVTFQQTIFSTIINLSWTPVPTASNYLATVLFNGVSQAADLPIGTITSVSKRGNALGTYDVTIKALFACGAVGVPSMTRLVVDGAPPPGPRTPDPAPGQQLSIPSYFRSVVDEMAAERPDLLRNSCVDTGGNNRWLFELVKKLRARDNRWGNNIKRCGQGLSQDIVTYNTSSLPDEGARTNALTTERNMRLFDTIGGHCGPNPGPNYTDVTQATLDGGACAEWTLQYYMAAGYVP